MEARALMASDGMDLIRRAAESGSSVSVMIGKRPIQFEPARAEFEAARSFSERAWKEIADAITE